MYKNILRSADQYFARALALPKNVQIEGPEMLIVGEHLGSLGLVVAAGAVPVRLAAGKKINISLLESDSKDGPFTAMPLAFSFTFANGLADVPEGDQMLQLVLPECKKFVKAGIGTDDASAAGTIDVFMNYLAR